MKNVKLSLLCILGLQSMMMQAAVESKDDYQDKRQAIIDKAMQPENYIELKKGFAFLQSQGLNVPSFHDVLEQNVPQSDDEDLDLHAITAQAEDILALHMKKPFIATLEMALKQKKILNQFQDPLFVYVMQHKDDYMKDMVHSWLYEWSKTKDNFNNTPLHKAARNHNGAKIVSMLLAAGVDVNLQDDDGLTPLYQAAQNNSVEVVRTLIDAGADINFRNRIGHTPLCSAAIQNNTEVVRMLIDAGADVNIQNYYGRTAEQLAHTDKMRAIFAQVRQQKQDARAMAVFNNQIKKDWR